MICTRRFETEVSEEWRKLNIFILLHIIMQLLLLNERISFIYKQDMCVTSNPLLLLNVYGTTNWPDWHGASKGKMEKLFAPWTRLCWLRWNDGQHTVHPLTMAAGLSVSQRWQWIWADRIKSWSDFLSFHRGLGLYEVYDRSVESSLF